MSELLAVLRPSGVLGDRSDVTRVTDSATAVGTPQAGTLTVKAASLLPQVANGTIDYLVIGVRAKVTDTHGATSQNRIVWMSGGGMDFDDVTPWSLAVVSLSKTDPQTTDPAGNPWTWASAMAMTEVGAAVDYTLSPGQTATLEVAEVFAEVWGASPGPFIEGSGLHGPVLGEGIHGDVEAAGLHGPHAGEGVHGDIAGSGLHGPILGEGKVGGT